MNIEIVVIADEVLFGQTNDTNSWWISRRLSREGMRVRHISVVGDDEKQIRDAFQRAHHRSDVVLITGGLGPTEDDMTKEILAGFFNLPIVFRNDILQQVRERYRQRELDFAEASREQAEFPEGAVPMPNRHGTAPGIWIERDGRIYAAMPGVPGEMRGMMDSFVVPRLIKAHRGPITLFRTLSTFGIIEARLYEKIDNRKKIQDHADLAFLPSSQGVKIRLTVEAESREEANRRLDRAEELVREKADDVIFAVGEDVALEKSVGEMLKQRGWHLAVAESCTGGLLGKRITDIPGSSGWFERGFVTYTNEAKIELLGVDRELIEKHGAVSAEVAEAMADGALKNSHAHAALAITGIAGPEGGTGEKPVGLTYIGYADAGQVTHQRFVFGHDRRGNRTWAASRALTLLLEKLRESSEEADEPRLV